MRNRNLSRFAGPKCSSTNLLVVVMLVLASSWGIASAHGASDVTTPETAIQESVAPRLIPGPGGFLILNPALPGVDGESANGQKPLPPALVPGPDGQLVPRVLPPVQEAPRPPALIPGPDGRLMLSPEMAANAGKPAPPLLVPGPDGRLVPVQPPTSGAVQPPLVNPVFPSGTPEPKAP